LANPEYNLDFSNYECVIICAAITNIAYCETDPENCERINSINTIKLIERCVDSNCFVIFLSSNAVFDGSKQFYNHTDPPNPNTFYGKSKLLVENYIQSLNTNQACILRLTKVITEYSQFIQKLDKCC
jgi:dTDP-4-dehydrorhamnose reductase